jgi:anti-repressor protein
MSNEIQERDLKMDDLQVTQGVRCYLDGDGVAQLHIGDVAHGLGFTRQQNKDGKVYESIRWERIRGHFEEFGFHPQVGEDDYIPENIFYKLCFKASSETARKFQDKVTDEILPAIRKHGAYMTPENIEKVLLNPDTIIKIATQLKEERAAKERLQTEVAEMKPKALFADAVSASDGTILIGELAKILKGNGIDIGQNRLFGWLRKNRYLISRDGSDYNMPSQRGMELGLFRIKETAITHADGHVTVAKTVKVTARGQIYFVNKFLAEKPGA